MISSLTRLLQRGTRHLSTYQPPTLTAKHNIYVSQSTDPYFNLTFEDWYVPMLSSLAWTALYLQVVQGKADRRATPAHLSQ